MNTVEPGAGIHPAQAQHPGQRSAQQDACGFSDDDDVGYVTHAGHLAVLADGMGGSQRGEWASAQAVQAVLAAYHAKTADEAIPAALQRALHAANAAVHAEALRLDAVDRMGSTLALAVVQGLQLHWLNIGDSRVYLAEGGHLMRLSTDHRYAEHLRRRVHRGELSAGEALAHPLRDALTSYLGRPPPLRHAASAAALQLRPGARVLLCSDGLTQALDDARIAALLHGSAQDCCDRLLQAALARGLRDQDNITAVVLQVPRPGEAPEAGSISRAIYEPVAEADAAAAPAAATGASTSKVSHIAEGAALRSRWREPLWWAGAAAAAAALGLLWLARPAGTPPAPAARSGPAVDLMAPPASAAGIASSSNPDARP